MKQLKRRRICERVAEKYSYDSGRMARWADMEAREEKETKEREIRSSQFSIFPLAIIWYEGSVGMVD
jgi:hypothetical protein